jgi:Leucine-rich repeat (LRR) protein
LNAEYNNLTSLDLTHNPELEILSFDNNDITTIDLSQNPNLRIVDLHNNLLTSLDISQNPLVTKVWCYNNQFESLNIQNGNNTAFTGFNAENNPGLTCIQVDDEAYANSQVNWRKDVIATYSENCALGIDDVVDLSTEIVLYPNPVTNSMYLQNTTGLTIDSIQLFDVLGRQVLEEVIHTDSIDLSNLTDGVFFVNIHCTEGNLIKRIIKGTSF